MCEKMNIASEFYFAILMDRAFMVNDWMYVRVHVAASTHNYLELINCMVRYIINY